MAIITCMKSLLPIYWWKGEPHLSINMSRRPSERNIALGRFVFSRLQTPKAATLALRGLAISLTFLLSR